MPLLALLFGELASAFFDRAPSSGVSWRLTSSMSVGSVDALHFHDQPPPASRNSRSGPASSSARNRRPARDSRLNRDVALKVLPAIFAADPERLARLHREAQVLASLNHSYIAQIYGFEESNEGRALVLELVEGETLADRIGRGRMPIPERFWTCATGRSHRSAGCSQSR